MLAYGVAAIGLLIGLLGAAFMAVPQFFRNTIPRAQTQRVIYVAVSFRLLAGAYMIFASSLCAWPMAVGTIGVMMLVAGFTGIFVGLDRLKTLTTWFLSFSDTVLRAWALIAVAFGAFVIYAAI